jgi:GNAT superfamily N-acetyltransferase
MNWRRHREVRITVLDPATASEKDVSSVRDMLAAALAVDRPGHPALAVEDVAAELRTPLVGRRRLRYVAEQDGRIVGLLVVRLPDLDNLHLGLLDLVVHPGFRRRGIGTELLRTALTVLTGQRRRILLADTQEGGAGTAFCAAHGLRAAKTDQLSMLRMADVDWPDIAALADADHPGYRMVGWRGSCPDELLDAFARAKYAMNDAPAGDLDLEARTWPTEFIRDWERECLTLNREQRVLAAVHEADGTIAGFTEVELWGWTPARSEQADTAVVPTHRGRGLGLWLKAAMLRQLRTERPDVTSLLTGNAAGNVPMLNINTRLGYRPYVRLTEWQADVHQLSACLIGADPRPPG